MKEKVTTNKFINKLVYLFGLLIVAILICYLLTTLSNLLKKSNNVIILETGSVSKQEETEGLIIRDETVISGENYQNGMLKIKTEGEKVAKNEVAFRYLGTTESDTKKKIEEIEEKIQENIPKDDNIGLSDIPLIEEQIKNRVQELYKENDIQKIKETKKDINTYLNKKIGVVSNLPNGNSEIKQLLKQKEQLENELTKNSEYVKAPRSGIVSYRVDNFEDKLTIDNFDYINKEFIDSIDEKTLKITASSEEKAKIINNFEAYIAVNVKSTEAKKAKIDDNVKILFSNSDVINAQIKYINVEKDDSRTIVFKITKKIEELIKYRKISLTVIWWEVEGYKVPNSAVVTQEGKSYVVRNRNGYKDNILVKIMRQNDSFSIIDNYSTDELKQMGYSNKEIINMSKLNLYDEIIMTP